MNFNDFRGVVFEPQKWPNQVPCKSRWLQCPQSGSQIVDVTHAQARIRPCQDGSKMVRGGGREDRPSLRPPLKRPRWLKMAPRWLQDVPRWPQDGFKMPQEGPRWPQDGPKMAPRWPRTGPETPLKTLCRPRKVF